MAKKKRLFWQLYPSYLFITLISLTAVAWYASRSFESFYLDQMAEDLKFRARLIEKVVTDKLETGNEVMLQEYCEEMGEIGQMRITLVLKSGKVSCDSEINPTVMDNHTNRPEIGAALAGEIGISKRYSDTLQREMLYVAVPVYDGPEIKLVTRASIDVGVIHQTLRTINYRIAIAGIVITLLAALLSLLVSRKITLPLERLRVGAKRFARGEFGHRLPQTNSEEISSLANAMNQMAEELDDRITAVVRQRNELEVVLSNMTEGVIVVDNDRTLTRANGAAARLVGFNSVYALEGKKIEDVIPNEQLKQFITKALQSSKPVTGEIALSDPVELYLQAHGTALRDVHGFSFGALVVLNDVTGLRKLENVRRDFVANVSHELKTPITSIKASVETLLDGGPEEFANSSYFLDIISRHSDRLDAIIEDLLSLSRIELDAEREKINYEQVSIKAALHEAVDLCENKITEKKVDVTIKCDSGLTAQINRPLIEQALVNLLDNAVKYSNPGGSIKVSAKKTGEEIVISVTDEGRGIPGEHLDRLFERFYRVDKARSRALGGTGLGLAIVKHIVNAHGGQVTVKSEPEKGSTFIIHLPLA
jgi:two-component system, OmpR family, phosphate regulon sensor histidine kinase PhoR